jgi:hypothetical protein
MSSVSNIQPFSSKDLARRRKRSVALALALGGLVVLFFITTVVRLGGDVAMRSF